MLDFARTTAYGLLQLRVAFHLQPEFEECRLYTTSEMLAVIMLHTE